MPPYEQTPIPAKTMLRAVQGLESFIGKDVVDKLIKNLAKDGVELNNQDKSYSLAEVQIGLAQTFGAGATDLLIRKLRQDLP